MGVLERARGRYPAHQQVIDLLVPLARHLRAQRQASHAASVGATQQPEPSTAPSTPMRSIKPSMVERIERMRQEFADDPEGFRFLLDLATISTSSGEPAATTAAPSSAPGESHS